MDKNYPMKLNCHSYTDRGYSCFFFGSVGTVFCLMNAIMEFHQRLDLLLMIEIIYFFFSSFPPFLKIILI